MASWQEFCTFAGNHAGMRMGEGGWFFSFPTGERREQNIFVIYEFMKPDFEFLRIVSPFASIGSVNCFEILKRFGHFNIGAIGFTPAPSGADPSHGVVGLSTSIPLDMIAPSDAAKFYRYLNEFANAANSIALDLSPAR